jgi:2'-5' RNA ligase
MRIVAASHAKDVAIDGAGTFETADREAADKIRFSYETSICIVPRDVDLDAWKQVSDARVRLKDKGFYRWPPHVNMFYPFIEKGRIDEVVPALMEVLKDFSPFEVTLKELKMFGGAKRGVLWLDPEPTHDEAYIRDIQAAMCKVMPTSIREDTLRHYERFVPHLTLSHCSNLEDATEKRADMLADGSYPWHEVTFRVDELLIITRGPPDDQYRIAWRLPLGRKEEMDGVVDREGGGKDVQLEAIKEDNQRFALQPLEEAVWVREAKKEYNRKRPKRRK